MFTHLNVHSQSSPMGGTASIEAIVKRAKHMTMTHLAITETNGLWGFINFTRIARQAGIQAVCGAHIRLGTAQATPPEQDAILLVENRDGYSNLCRLISEVHDDKSSDLPVLLEKFGHGLFVLCPSTELLQRLLTVVPNDHLYGELRPGIDTMVMLEMCRTNPINPVATGDVCFLDPGDAELYHLLRAIDRNERLSDLPGWERKSAAHHFANEEEMRRRYPHCPEALTNTTILANRCHTDWDFSTTIFPGMESGKNAADELRKLVYDGAGKRYPQPLASEVKARIERELDLICRKGFAPYFLVVNDIVGQSHLTIGRGSGAASIVSYCLFITQVDPVRHNLMFERFLHEERTDLPDIDVDFAWDERDDILKYVFRKYGYERVAMVANHVTLQTRSAIREVGKVMGLSNEEILAVTRRVSTIMSEAGHPNGGNHPLQLDRINFFSTGNDGTPALHINETLEQVLQLAVRLVGTFHYPSVHPGGVIVVPDEIRRYVPVLMAPKGVPIVQWEKDQVEDAGLVKIDLLGNRSLAVVRDCLRHINLYRDPNDHMDYHHITPVGDESTAKMMAAGRTMGIFYIESPATRQLLAKAGKVDFAHVVIYSSIIRPAANRYINLLIERIHGAPWELPHPDLNFLEESYGIMVYEEQVFLAAVVMAGFSYGEADILRKIGTKRSLRPKIPALKHQFMYQALKRGYSESIVQDIWDMIESFKGYSFCKPHSASFAMLSFTCAYLKAHYPAEFLASVISNRGGYYSAYAYMSEARRHDITILLPHINRSHPEWKGHARKIRVGFSEIRSLPATALETIITERKKGDFTSLADFLERTLLPPASCRALIRAGCFDDLEPSRSRPDMMLQLMGHHAALVTGSQTGTGVLGGMESQLDTRSNGRNGTPTMRSLTTRQLFDMEMESFGYPITWHPLAPFRRMLQGRILNATNIGDNVGRTVTLAGVCLTIKTAKTKAGNPMEFLTFEDETALFECVLFPEQYKRYNDLVRWERLLLIRGKVEEAWGTYTVTIEQIASLPQTAEKWEQRTKTRDESSMR